MKKFIALLIIALVILVVLLFWTNPELLSKVWMYIIGFIGYVALLAENGYKSIIKAFKNEDNSTADSLVKQPVSPKTATPPNVENDTIIRRLEQKIGGMEKQLRDIDVAGNALSSQTLTVLRYTDDGETTLGLLFLRNRFFAYTLEDTHREQKIPGKTRIPSGIYPVDFNRNATRMTVDYRKTRPWFDFHLEIKNIPDFQGVYIHVGNTHEHTEGCILIADGVNAGPRKSILQSNLAFERFYKKISALLRSGEQVSIQILDEDWFEQSKLTKL